MNTAESQHAQELIAAAQSQPERFPELYDQNFHRVWAWVIRRTRNRAEAEDVTSEVFNLGSYEWRGVPFPAWLLRITANMLANRREKLGRESADPSPEAAGGSRIRNSEPCCSNSSSGYPGRRDPGPNRGCGQTNAAPGTGESAGGMEAGHA